MMPHDPYTIDYDACHRFAAAIDRQMAPATTELAATVRRVIDAVQHTVNQIVAIEQRDVHRRRTWARWRQRQARRQNRRRN